jgi:arsenate reductase
MAARLSAADVGLQLLENSVATMLALAVLILVFGPVSGGHLNPVVTLIDWWLHRRAGNGLSFREAVGYVGAQTAGGIGGAVLANLMFSLAPVTFSRTERATANLWLGEGVATAGLVLLVFTLVRTQRTALVPPAVGAYIGAAYWFTSSTSFANPAVTAGRAFSDTFAGIAPASVPAFVAAQLVGGLAGLGLLLALYPRGGLAAEQSAVPHDGETVG